MPEKKEPVEVQFGNDLCRSIEITANSWSGKPSQTFKPSSMNCRRASYYQIIGQEPDREETTFNNVGIVNSGSDIHERVQTYISQMKNNGMDCDWVDVGNYVKTHELEDVVVREKKGMETKLYNQKYNISFMCDGIIRYKGRYYIVEIKTETSNKWFTRDAVDAKHHNQAIAYSLSLALQDVIFIYVDRDMLHMKFFMFHVEPGMIKSMLEYITDTQSYVDKHITPPKPENIKRSVCTYCGYKSVCRREA